MPALYMLFIMLFAYSCSSDKDDLGVYKDDESVRYDSFTDPRDSMEYRTIETGGKTWLADNLKYNEQLGSACYPGSAGCDSTFVRAYSWAVAMNLADSCNYKVCKNLIKSNHRGLCPEGWHIPSNAEWETNSDRSFYTNLGLGFIWWSANESEEHSEEYAYIWNMPVQTEPIRKYIEKKFYKKSVRCVKD